MYVLSAVCMDPYARIRIFFRGCVWIHTLGYASFFVVSIKLHGSFARVWINTSLSNQALTLAPDNLLLFSLPGAIGVSEAQRRWCTRLSLTPVLYHPEEDIVKRTYVSLLLIVSKV
jgi:hypothetical protein